MGAAYAQYKYGNTIARMRVDGGGDAWGGGASMRGTGGPGIPSQSESMPNALCRQVDQSPLSSSSLLASPNSRFGPRQNLLRAIIKLSGPKIRWGGIKETNW